MALMERSALEDLKVWYHLPPHQRKPLVLRGARQVGKSYLVRDFCRRQGLELFELNFEKEPSLARLFVEGANSRTLSLLETHFRKPIAGGLLFLDEIQAAPAVFARLRYFFEDSPQIAVIAAGSLLEFTLGELEQSVPVGRIQYLHLGPMGFVEFLKAQNEHALCEAMVSWAPGTDAASTVDAFHDRLLAHAHDFSIVGGMPEAVSRFLPARDFLGTEAVQRALLETYSQDFAKYRKRIPLERMERVFRAIPAHVGKKWVHARANPDEKALATAGALDALCKARVAHRVHHVSGNGVPLGAERKDGIFKMLCMDVGLMSRALGLRVTDAVAANAGSLREQWVGQHLLDQRSLDAPPELHYWVREKAGALAEVDYLVVHGGRAVPVEVKSGAPARAKSLRVFMDEKKAPLGLLFSIARPSQGAGGILHLPYYMSAVLMSVLERR